MIIWLAQNFAQEVTVKQKLHTGIVFDTSKKKQKKKKKKNIFFFIILGDS